MPQMAPMMWLTQMLMFNLIIMLLMTNLYYMIKTNMNTFFNKNIKKLIWKW